MKAGRLKKNERARAERENAASPGAAARGEDNALSVKVTDETRACMWLEIQDEKPVNTLVTVCKCEGM